MANTLFINQPFVLEGLQTWTYTVPAGAGGAYSVHMESTEVPLSGVTVVVNKNAVAQFTAPALGQTQGAFQFKFSMLLAAADVVTVVMTSAAAIDSQLNNVKSTVTIQQGF